jgi:serine phosphatase RsbU (regulator of sigma subunit)
MLQHDKQSAVATTLLERLDATESDDFVDAVFEVLSACFAIRHAWLYLIDYGENFLRPLPTTSAPPPPSDHLDIRAGLPGEVISSRTPRTDDADKSLVWLPISQRGEAVGVLSVGMRDAADTGVLLDVANGLTVALGAAIVGARRRYDLLETTRGAAELTLEAAVQWSVLAPTIHEEPELHVAARVEPSTKHGGDAWDFSLRTGAVSFALFDAVGHGVDAANLSALAINTYRWSRRCGDRIEVSVAAMDRVIATYGGGEDRFVTALVCDLDRRTGMLAWVCAGHPPLVVTDGEARAVSADEPTRPLGLGGEIRVNRKRLAAGSVLLLYSDGVVEATDGTNDRYSVSRLERICVDRVRRERRLPVAIREILDDVRRHANARLPDDATLFGVRWQPPSTA